MKYALMLAMFSVCFNVQSTTWPLFERPTFKQKFEKEVRKFFLHNKKAEIEDPFFIGIELSNIFLKLQENEKLEFNREMEKFLSDYKDLQPYGEFQDHRSGYTVYHEFER